MPSIPCLGYPSKKAAIRALLDEGVDQPEIAKRCETSAMVVYSEARLYGREKARQPTGHDAVVARQVERDERRKASVAIREWQATGWNPEKVEKAVRICANAMGVIAQALGVPVKELVALYCDHVTPPMDGQLSDDAGQLKPEPKLFQEIAGDPPVKYRMEAKGGMFLKLKCDGLTAIPHLAWRGTASEAVAVRRNYPGTENFKLIPIPKVETANGRH